MSFSSLLFLFLFLPAALLVHAVVPNRGKNLCLLLFSLVFYAWSGPAALILMAVTILVDYVCGLLVSEYCDEAAGRRKRGRRKARAVMILNVTINLALLCLFKYAGLIIGSGSSLTGLELALPELLLPLGISFYTFRSITYAVDVYRGEAPATKNLIDFSLYIAFFPVITQGPIVRYKDMAGQLRKRRVSLHLFSQGLVRMMGGLFKKVLLADTLALLPQRVQSMGDPTALTAWLGALAFTFQIYFDFSGYSDMAIGIAQMFGFQLPENFDYPYQAKSASEFWRRWHMTLGTFFREYVYIPLGGNRCKRQRLVFNLAVVWVLTGVWHGASWNFALWGAYFGVLIIGEKLLWGKALQKLPDFVQWIYAFLLEVVGWVIFSHESMGGIGAALKAMLGFSGGADALGLYLLLTFLPILVIAAVCSSPLPARLSARLQKSGAAGRVLWCAGGAALFVLSMAAMLGSAYTPFLYAKF